MKAESDMADNISRGKDLSGITFGKLKVVRLGEIRHKAGGARKRYWLCVCHCGNSKAIHGEALKSGRTISCGCERTRKAIERETKHGLCGKTPHPIYLCYQNMKARCYNPNCIGFKNYGGRGIKVKEPWKSSRIQFFDDMLPSWEPGLTIERKDPNDHYCKENCTWTTKRLQGRNKSLTVRIKFNGATKSASEWAEHFKLNPQLVVRRFRDGWPAEACFFRGNLNSNDDIERFLNRNRKTGISFLHKPREARKSVEDYVCA